MHVDLPKPRYDGDLSLEQALHNRRSVRSYRDSPITLEAVSQLLWAAQGITASWGGRTAPSAGALYPIETHIVAGNVERLGAGVYRYNARQHALVKGADGDRRRDLARAGLGQRCIASSAVDIVFTAVLRRITGKYGKRGVQYTHMEAGHAAQNVLLQAGALGLGAVPIGAFREEPVAQALGLQSEEEPLYVIAVGPM